MGVAEEEEGRRKLSAVLFTDMVGFTLLTQRQEDIALKLLEEHRKILRPVFETYKGRVVKTIGDAFLAEFESALNATNCAVEIQRILHDLNLARSEHNKMLVRIGIHAGDVVQREGDLYGDAVNIASRVEPLAAPGGICITEQVYLEVRNKIPYQITKLSPQSLKNISYPMEIYEIVLPWLAQAGEERAVARFPKTRLAVLPFVNISPDPNDSYFADGITEEIINSLSNLRGLRVIARTSISKYKDHSRSISEIARELQVGSLVEGSVRKFGDRVRITAQLIDAESEEHLWAESFDRKIEDIFEIQSEIAERISKSLKLVLLEGDRKNIERRPTKSVSAYAKYLKARILLRERTKSSMIDAKNLFEESIADDPDFAEAYAGLTDAYMLLGQYAHISMEEAFRRSNDLLSKALSLNEDLSEIHTSLGGILHWEYKFQEAESEFRNAISINPNYATAHHWYSIVLADMGRFEDAFIESRLAEEADPLSLVISGNLPFQYATRGMRVEAIKTIEKIESLSEKKYLADAARADVYMIEGEFEKSLEYMRKAVSEEKMVEGGVEDLDLATLALLYSRVGKLDEAKLTVRELQSFPKDRFGVSFALGIALLGIGNLEDGFNHLERSYEELSLKFRYLRALPIEDEVKNHPRFVALFKRANLQPNWYSMHE